MQSLAVPAPTRPWVAGQVRHALPWCHWQPTPIASAHRPSDSIHTATGHSLLSTKGRHPPDHLTASPRRRSTCFRSSTAIASPRPSVCLPSAIRLHPLHALNRPCHAEGRLPAELSARSLHHVERGAQGASRQRDTRRGHPPPSCSWRQVRCRGRQRRGRVASIEVQLSTDALLRPKCRPNRLSWGPGRGGNDRTPSEPMTE